MILMLQNGMSQENILKNLSRVNYTKDLLKHKKCFEKEKMKFQDMISY